MCFRIFDPNDDLSKIIFIARIVSITFDFRISLWNAGSGLVYDEWIFWND